MESDKFVTPFPLKHKVIRFLFSIIWTLFVRPFPRAVLRRWNVVVLNLFGAKIHSTCVVYSSAKIFSPSTLIMDEGACLAGNTIVENAATVHLKANSIVSQYTYLCTASHDIRKKNFKQFSKPIVIGERSWVTARCFIGPGVTIGDGAVVGAASAVFKDVEPWMVVGGNPAKVIGKRDLKNE